MSSLHFIGCSFLYEYSNKTHAKLNNLSGHVLRVRSTHKFQELNFPVYMSKYPVFIRIKRMQIK